MSLRRTGGSAGTERLVLEKLSGGYGGRIVFEDISLTVRAGEILVLAGPNGSGKTTLLKTIGGLLKPASGRVLFDGREQREMTKPEQAAASAFLFQNTPLVWPFTVRETVAQGRFSRRGWFGGETAEDREAAAAAMEAAGLSDCGDRRVTELSGGEQQRVLIARAIAQDAGVLLLDEAVNNLDPRYQVLIMEMIRAMAGRGAAALISLHDLNLAALYGDRALLLSRGRAAALGSPPEVFSAETLREVFGLSMGVYAHPADSRIRIVLPPLSGE
ncbi:MAG: ABC transporter ATP-binding protein [Treponema sp.]|jgi:iron complex transport system ATP-binding protein|nr:ABC transporter ATP-binding protein [Treponema sp.]